MVKTNDPYRLLVIKLDDNEASVLLETYNEIMGGLAESELPERTNEYPEQKPFLIANTGSIKDRAENLAKTIKTDYSIHGIRDYRVFTEEVLEHPKIEVYHVYRTKYGGESLEAAIYIAVPEPDSKTLKVVQAKDWHNPGTERLSNWLNGITQKN